MNASRARPRAPIGVQLIALLIVCLLATHALTFVVLVLVPPPRPPLYRVSEIATALRGGSLSARFGRPMVRDVEAQPPKRLAQQPWPSPHVDALATALGLPRDQVRIAQRPPSWLEQLLNEPGDRRVVFEMRHGHAVRHGVGAQIEVRRFELQPGGPPPPGGRPRGVGPPPDTAYFAGRREFHMRMMADMPVFGDFTAAARRPDGRWDVVRASPEPFPSDWQMRGLLLLGVGLLVVAPAGYLFARRITAPLARFADAAERLGRDPQAPPMLVSGPAEIGAAAEAFNNMQARVKRYIDDRTAMVGAISHDLRTPLARIRFKLEGAPKALKDSVLGDVGQMEQMIQGVLTFIRDQSTPRTREKLDLLSLVECVADDAAMLGGDVEIIGTTPVTVEGDPVALQRLFVNLVDNAVKYGGQARIQVRRDDGHAVVDVTDAGEGLEPAELERVFQPFYRGDPSRNLDAGGIGLGLPIARSTARAHGGDVELANAPEKGLRARVTLPLA